MTFYSSAQREGPASRYSTIDKERETGKERGEAAVMKQLLCQNPSGSHTQSRGRDKVNTGLKQECQSDVARDDRCILTALTAHDGNAHTERAEEK